MKFIYLIFITILFLSSVNASCTKNQIDINSASLKKLDDIVWVGVVTAQKIINSRPYKTLDELKKVKGVGDKKIQAIKKQNLACVKEKDSNTTTNTITTMAVSTKDAHKKHNSTKQNTPKETTTIHNKTITLTPKKSPKTILLNNPRKNQQPIYTSKNSKVMSKLPYIFSIFLIFVIVVLVWERF